MDPSLSSALGILKWIGIALGVLFLWLWLDLKWQEWKEACEERKEREKEGPE